MVRSGNLPNRRGTHALAPKFDVDTNSVVVNARVVRVVEIRRLRISFRRSLEGSRSYGTETIPSCSGDRSTGGRRAHAAPTALGHGGPLSSVGSDGAPDAAELAAQSSAHSAGLRTSEAISPYPGCFALEPGRSTDSGAIGNDPSFLSY